MKNRSFAQACLLALFVFAGASPAQAQSSWRIHDLERPKPTIVTPPAQILPVPPPSDAVVLFDGTDLSNWEATDGTATKWVMKDGVMESVAGAGYIRTKQGFGDIQLHVEWAAPLPVKGSSQGRGNSGVFLMGKYEVQVLDSYENETYADGQAAAIYGQYPPLVNASRPPGEWQSYDIMFRRPRFGNRGQLLKPARITVIHNGILVQDNVEVWGGTNWLEYSPYEAHPDRLPLAFQDHGNPVRYRNVWLRELPEEAPMADEVAFSPPMSNLTHEELDRYVGRYQVFGNNVYTIVREGDVMKAMLNGINYQMLEPRSATTFDLVKTSGSLEFDLDDTGHPTGVTFSMSGSVNKAKKID